MKSVERDHDRGRRHPVTRPDRACGRRRPGEHGIGAAPVVEDGRIVGLLRDEDLIVSEAKLHVPTVIEFLGADLVWPGSEKRWERELKKAAASTVRDVMTTEFPTRRAAPTPSRRWPPSCTTRA